MLFFFKIKFMEFSEFAGLCQRLQQTKSRLKLISYLCDFFKSLSPSEARISTYLLLGRPFHLTQNLGLISHGQVF